MLGTPQGTWDTSMKKADKCPCPYEAHILSSRERQTDNKLNK